MLDVPQRRPFTDAARLHAPAEVGQEPVTAQRSATKMYRTTPLRALWQHPPYFHDGSAATLPAVVTHYNTHMTLGLTAAGASGPGRVPEVAVKQRQRSPPATPRGAWAGPRSRRAPWL